MKHFSAAKRVIAGMTAFGLLSLFVLSPLPALAESEQEVPYTEISDASGLASIAAAPDGNYRLTEDIDLGGANWRPVAFTACNGGRGGKTLVPRRKREKIQYRICRLVFYHRKRRDFRSFHQRGMGGNIRPQPLLCGYSDRIL